LVHLQTEQQRIELEDLEPFSIHWAHSPSEIEEVQRLRFRVFSEELGVTLHGQEGIDSDQYDELSKHLYVRNTQTGKVIGTYRLITPDVAASIGWYTASEFDISNLLASGQKVLEVGRACVDKDFRHGAVVLMLWKAILQYAKKNAYTCIIGCTSVPINANSPAVFDVQELLLQSGSFSNDFLVTPRIPFTAEMQVPVHAEVKKALPALFKGYLRLGGKFCGEPTYDADFHCADFFTYLPMNGLSKKYARHFELE
jgi:putative hemolysin